MLLYNNKELSAQLNTSMKKEPRPKKIDGSRYFLYGMTVKLYFFEADSAGFNLSKSEIVTIS